MRGKFKSKRQSMPPPHVQIQNELIFYFTCRPAAGLLMNFSRGCDTVLSLMGPTTAPSSPSNSCCNSDGYHSDSDSEENYNELVQQYKSLYIKNRAEALNALDALPQLKRGHHLKTKILFSIIVVRTRTPFFHLLVFFISVFAAHIWICWSAAARGIA